MLTFSPQLAGPGGPTPRQWLLCPELSPTPLVPSCPLAGPLGCTVQAQRGALFPLAGSWRPLVTHPVAGWSCGGRRLHLHCPWRSLGGSKDCPWQWLRPQPARRVGKPAGVGGGWRVEGGLEPGVGVEVAQTLGPQVWWRWCPPVSPPTSVSSGLLVAPPTSQRGLGPGRGSMPFPKERWAPWGVWTR